MLNVYFSHQLHTNYVVILCKTYDIVSCDFKNRNIAVRRRLQIILNKNKSKSMRKSKVF